MSRKRAVPPITWTILCFLLLAVGVTPYAKTANIILIVVRLVSIVVISVLGVREWWKYYHRDPHWSNVPPDGVSNFLRKVRGWAIDEEPPQHQSPASQIVEGGCYQTPPAGTPRWRAAEIVTITVVVLVIAAVAFWRK
jgi:hypothetical protein